ncbi:MAG: elongation factor 1-beta [Candidatus Helarchaeota archaeon]
MSKKVMVQLKVLPEDIDTDLEELLKKIGTILPEDIGIYKYDIQPVAFGLKVLKLTVFMPENKEGGPDSAVELIEKLEDVQRVEIGLVSLI